MNDSSTHESHVYHWTELRRGVHVSIIPEMLKPGGYAWPVNCRLKGESTKGWSAVPPKERLAIFDIDYCVDKFNQHLQNLSPEEKMYLFERIIADTKRDAPVSSDESEGPV